MKEIICYYSGSGNTRLAAEYIKNRVRNADFELCDIVREESPELSQYEIVGFATFADFGGAPRLMHTFFDGLNPRPGGYAFVFNTYGFLSGKTLRSLARMAAGRGFTVIDGHSLHTPESYPPMRARNRTFENAPSQKELRRFNEFISRLDSKLAAIREGNEPGIEKIRIGLSGMLFPGLSRDRAKRDMGEQQVDTSLCQQCGTGQRLCPYGAIQLSPHPVFDHGKCNGCWSCYNHCPEKAIHTRKVRGDWQYPEPVPELVDKLKGL